MAHVKIGTTSWCNFSGKVCAQLEELARAERPKLSLSCSYASLAEAQRAVDFINARLPWFEVAEKAVAIDAGCDQRDDDSWQYDEK